jgi:hypothetical protein
MSRLSFGLLLVSLMGSCGLTQAQTPLIHWNFEQVTNRNTLEVTRNRRDTIEGNFQQIQGARGLGLHLDGFTACLRGKASRQPENLKEFTVEAWVALSEYPLNWCPVLTTESNEIKGYRLMAGPAGQVSFQCAIGSQWISCSSKSQTIPIRHWIHVAGVYRENDRLELYVNGEIESTLKIHGAFTPTQADIVCGMVAQPGKPSETIRTWGTVAQYFGLDGILDEIQLYDVALQAGTIKQQFACASPAACTLPERKLPRLEKDPGKFGAYYTKLKYYQGWDSLWPVDQDPDIVVCFEHSPVKLIFWRGIRYGPAWVSENELWMADQSLETWGVGKDDLEGCFEHMQDRHCRFSHVRLIENSDARVVVHWRYAPVSSWDHTWLPDPKTGWECWVDEYYYIYPDGSAIRKVSWNKGSTGPNLQLQESLPLTQPGQQREDVVEREYVHVADYDYQTIAVSMDPAIRPANWTGNYTVQQYNFKSENKPYICFEPGNSMWIRWIGGSYNHFPVNQARSDGRWAKTTDRPTHFMSSPCSDPVVHEDGNRLWWIGLYGMNTLSMTELVSFGRSWAYAPELIAEGDIIFHGYDRNERCYQLESQGTGDKPVEITLMGSKEKPVINPALMISNWNHESAKITVNGKTVKGTKVGINHELNGSNLLVYLPIHVQKPVKIRMKAP